MVVITFLLFSWGYVSPSVGFPEKVIEKLDFHCLAVSVAHNWGELEQSPTLRYIRDRGSDLYVGMGVVEMF